MTHIPGLQSRADGPTTMRRFYKTVSVLPADTGFIVALDGKPVRTPARAPMIVPSSRLAEAIAAEWEAQTETIVPAGMHRTQLAATAIDRVAGNRDAVIDEVAAYGDTDLLCYRAEAPRALAERQQAVWQPFLDWCAIAHDAPLTAVEGIMHRPQPLQALQALRRAVAAHDDLRLTALHTATVLLGSVVLGLALVSRRTAAADAFAASVVDEDFQIARWGEDAEAMRRRVAIRTELDAIEDFVERLSG